MQINGIGFLCTSKSMGGLELNVIRLAKWMSERGWNVVMITSPESPLAEKCNSLGLKTTCLSKKYKYLDLKGIMTLRNIISTNNISTLIVSYNLDSTLAVFTKSFFGKSLQLVYQQHMQLSVSKRDPVHTLRFSRFDVWLSPSITLAEQVKSKTRINPKKIRVIPFGVEAKKYLTRIPKSEARSTLGLPLHATILGVVGRIDVQKGQHTAIYALSELRKQKDNVCLAIVGDVTKNEGNAYLEYICNLVRELGVENHVYFLPYMEEVHLIYNALDVFIMPSYAESYGMVTIEAMISGIPVVGTNTGGTPELLKNGELGLLFPPRKSNELAKQVNHLLDHPKETQTMAQNAKLEAIKNYSHIKQCELVEEVLINAMPQVQRKIPKNRYRFEVSVDKHPPLNEGYIGLA